MTTLQDFSATSLDGQDVDLSAYAGQVVLVVNTASKCGFTPQYEGLQKLHDAYADQGFTVLGFPCDQFGHQEPGDDAEIGAFCEKNFGVTFPMFSKIEVNGDGAHPLYQWLRKEKGGLLGGKIKWNFTKYLVGKDGEVIGRYAPDHQAREDRRRHREGAHGLRDHLHRLDHRRGDRPGRARPRLGGPRRPRPGRASSRRSSSRSRPTASTGSGACRASTCSARASRRRSPSG